MVVADSQNGGAITDQRSRAGNIKEPTKRIKKTANTTLQIRGAGEDFKTNYIDKNMGYSKKIERHYVKSYLRALKKD